MADTTLTVRDRLARLGPAAVTAAAQLVASAPPIPPDARDLIAAVLGPAHCGRPAA